MDKSVALRVAKRFITLPLDKRKLYLEKMLEEGVSPANLPIPETRSGFAAIPLSYAQERQLFLWQMDPHSSAYHIPSALRLKGQLDVAALERSFNALVARHESLRTTFAEQGETFCQVIHPHMPLSISVEPLPQGLDAGGVEACIKAFVEAQTSRPFDLQHGPLLRVALLQVAQDDHVLALIQHHIISDGWSMQVLVGELIQHYAADTSGQALTLPALDVQYADYAIWQRHWLEAGERERQLAYWVKTLGSEQPVLELPIDQPRPAVQSFRGARLDLQLPAALADALKQLAQREGASLFMLLLASFQALLHRYSGQSQIRVGVPTANRNRVETEGLIGFFVNTQVLSAEVHGQLPFNQLLAQVKQAAMAAQAHQDLPFEQLIEALQPERSLSHSPLFQVMYNHQAINEQAQRQSQRQLPQLSVADIVWEGRTAQFDLTLGTYESSEGVAAELTYATDLFKPDTIERLARHWQNLLQGIVAAPTQRIGELPLLEDREHKVLLQDWWRVADHAANAECVHQAFAWQAQQTPDATALIIGEDALTYGELETRANQLAHQLIEAGVGPDRLVGIAVERSVEMIVGLLAILKAGGAYVPLDPAYPQDRLAYMIEDSGLQLLLTQTHLQAQLPVPPGVQTLLLDQPAERLAAYPQTAPEVAVNGEHLAYTIYTSGSTGKPKGVMVRHAALSNFVASMIEQPGLSAADRMLSLTTFSFDIFALEIYAPLLAGACVVLTGKDVHQDPQAVLELIERHAVSILQATPSTWRMLLDNAHATLLSGRTFLCGGEALSQELATRMLALTPRVWNLYGPTETTIWSAQHALSVDNSRPFLGTPVANTALYILGSDLALNPLGAPGELLIGGEGLARGYLQRPGLTAERFVPDPFAKNGARLYRTGDLTRYRADGVIEYIGRIDHQVKIRGFRIELGEIEARLLALDSVREAIVVAQEGPTGAQLVGYVVPAASDAAHADLRAALKASLKAELPEYMVPAHLLFLAQLPLTPNGKVDRKALPAPDASLLQSTYLAPQTATQHTVAEIWQAVLKLQQVGLSDNFFELGGHSLLVTQVVSRVRQALNVQVPLRTLFEHSTLVDFVAALGVEQAHRQPPIIALPRRQPLALSYAQERQWFLWQLEPDSTAYHVPAALRLRGELDLSALQRSFDALIARHESLRTCFVEEQGQTLQVIQAEAALDLQVQDVGNVEDDALQALVAEETRQLFNLQQGPLLRIKLLRLAADDHALIITLHHIVCDGWSMNIMVDELVALYAAHTLGRTAALPTLTVQYADYAAWQRQWMDAGERERQLNYWTAQLGDGDQPLLELPTDRPRPAEQSYRGARQDIPLSAELAAALKDLAQREHVTLFAVLLASFQTVLHRYSGQAEIRVGVPVANRNRVETEGLIGFFVNTQVLKAQFDSQQTFRSVLQQVKNTVLGAQAHQDLPFEQLVDALQPERSLSHAPLFQVLHNHQSQARREQGATRLPKLAIEGLSWVSHTAQFDLTLDTFESADNVWAELTYATDLFDAETMARFASHWTNLLHGIVADSGQRIADLPLQDAAERAATLRQWNPAVADFHSEQCLHSLIQAQAARAPQAIAVTCAEQSLSYGELNARANRLAHKLIASGVGPDVRVGLAVERSLDMLVGLLAILKAGGAYVPLDPSYPQERLSYMIGDSGIALLLTQSHLLARLPVPDCVRSLVLDQPDGLEGYSESNPQVLMSADNLAYVIYTSGSTGQPKGTLLAHRNVLRLFAATDAWFDFGPSDVWSLFHSYAFDFSVWEIFGALLYGGKLVVVPYEVSRSPQDFLALLCRAGVTVLNQTPSAFKQLMQVACASEHAAQPLALRYVVFGGEALEVKSLRPWFERFGDQAPQLINMYGITETTVHVTYRPLSMADLQRDASSPIGEPIGDLSWYLLDGDLNPVAKGCIGELYVGRAGLARGYLNRADLTALRFIPDPFAADGGRLYRTGDLARYRADGVIEYIGRIDHQVKIRGFRIELGEIEAQLLEQTAVRQAAVLAQPGLSGQQLVAYLVPNDEALLDASATQQTQWRDRVRAELKANLPDHMIPAHLLLLAQLPLTANGKLNRSALPSPDASQAQQVWQAPQSELEQRLAVIWQDVLKLPQVGLNDNFFELGGDSIISIQVVSRARQAGIRLNPKDLFQHQTIQRLAHVAQWADDASPIDQQAVTGVARLLPIQQQFFDDEIPERHHWNQSVLLKPGEPLDADKVEQVLRALVAHHDALRLSFSERDGVWQAEHRAVEDLPHDLLWQERVADAPALEALGNRAQRSLDLRKGPLLRAVLATLADGTQRLQLVIHHLAVDGVSWRILLEDLQNAYQQLLDAQPLKLPAKTSAFKDWSEHLQRYATSAALQQELAYWQACLRDVSTDLPCKNIDAGQHNRLAHTVQTRLDAQLTRQLLQEAPAAYRTQVNDLLLTALARVIGRWSGQASTLIQLEGHGREELFDGVDLSRTVGWFTSMFPVRLTPATTAGESIKQIKEQLRAVPDKGIGFGALRHLGDAQAQASLRALPTPRITFNYLGQFDGSFAADDGALFAPAPDNAGVDQSPDAPMGNWLTLNGQVYGGELSVGWTFSTERFDNDTIERLAAEYAEELALLIDHCLTPGVAGLTPSDFPLAGLTQAQLDGLPVAAQQIADIYPLSAMQQGMLFHSLYEQASGDYINQVRLDVDGLDPQRFQHAWQAAVDNHDILRTGFVWQGELARAVQVVHKQLDMPFSVLDWRERGDCQNELDTLAAAEQARGFDLGQGPLLRMVVVRLDEQRCHLIYTNHHILMDGWSNSQLLGEVLQRYAGETVPALAGRYRDYIAWLQRQDAQVSEQYWTAQLANLQEPTRLAQAIQSHIGDESRDGHGELYRFLDAGQTRRLGDFARQQKVTLNTLIQAAWLLLLQRLTGHASVAFGATVAGRPTELKGVEQQIGLFINTLPVIASPRPEHSVGQWLQSVQAQNIGLREHEHTPLFDIQRWAGQSGEALFDNILVFENYPVSQALEQGAPQELRFGAVNNHEQTNYPLTLAVNVSDELSLHYSYQRGQFTDSVIERLSAQLHNLLQQMVQSGETRLGSLDLLDAAERSVMVEQWNATAIDYPLEQGVHRLIEAQAERTPHAPALVFAGQTLSYEQLNVRANQLAHALIARGVGADVLVGIALERSLEMVVGLLAILKAGGAYVPLDPQYPRDRLSYMIADSGIDQLLTQAPLLADLPIPDHVQTLCLAADGADFAAQPTHNPQAACDASNLAYVIYTSGSTGMPKGAGNAHCALTNRLLWMQQAYALTAADSVLQKTPFSFDVSVWEFFWPLMTGARLVVAAPGDHRDPARLIALINEHRVTTLHFVPSMLQAFLQDGHVSSCTSLTRIVCSGEALQVDAQTQVFAKLPGAGLYNLYGPTEAAIDVTHWTCRDEGVDAVPIGQPIANLSTFILDSGLNPLPTGVAGELYLGGVGLARGYHRRPGLSAERFVASPFGDGERLYRTGDLARYRADGVIEYVGRIDHQVKLRGLRIELGEIEARLLEHAAVREAVVVARDVLGSQQLVAYLVPNDLAIVEADESQRTGLHDDLSNWLGARLPDYMVPAHRVWLAQMPLSPNGKLERKRLPALQFSTAQQHVEPTSAIEQTLVNIWKDVLGLERISITDSFFALGGDSIISIQVVSRARAQGIELSPKDLFQQPTIQQLALRAETSAGIRAPVAALIDMPLHGLSEAQIAQLPLPRGQLDGLYRLSPMQQGMLFLGLNSPQADLYINQVSIAVQGLQPLRFAAAWEAVARRHDILRTGFLWQDMAEPLQFVLADAPLPISVLDWRAQDHSAAALQALADAERAKGFDLDQPPLQRLTLVQVGEDSYQLIWTYHHILIDGWSSSQLIGEVLSQYSGQALAEAVPYRRYINWLQQQDAQASEGFWREHLALLDEPTYLADALVRTGSGQGHEALYSRLGETRTEQLKAFAQSQQITLNTLVQGAWLMLLSRYSGQRCVAFGATVAGRPASLPASESILGLFINTLPVIKNVPAEQAVGEWLRELQDFNLEMREREYTPLTDVQRWAGRAGQSLFDSIIVFENHPIDQALREWRDDSLQFGESSSAGLTDFPMDLMVTLEEGLVIEYMFLREHFDRATVEGIRSNMEGLLVALTQDPAQPLGRIGLPTAQALSPPPVPLPARTPVVHQRIAEWAMQRGEQTAVIFNGQTFSYADIDARANALAHALIAQGVGPEVRVGVALPRSENLIVALLAVLKAGGAYVPLDATYPRERLSYLMGDSGMALLLSDSTLQGVLPVPDNLQVLELDGLDLSAQSRVAPQVAVHADNLAYVIYTSGSTGQPKGVGVAHGALAMHCQAIGQRYEMSADDCELHFMSFAFDGAHERWLTTLTHGARLLMRDDSLWTAEQTYNALHEHRVSVAAFPPVYLQQLAEHAQQHGNPPPMRIYCFGGDAVPEASFELARRALKPQYIINGYGPTETVVTPLIWKAGADDRCGAAYAPIGSVVGERSGYVLDRDLNCLPIGIAGELYLGGALARGYLGRAGGTAERFVANPFSADGSRLYRTGDLVRQRADGTFDYLGRIDHQVKIRGFRIELGEIEARLKQQPGVRDAAVVAREGASGKQLLGYVLAGRDAPVNGFCEQLREQLKASLPDYMVPTHLTLLERMPLTPNGKLDRKALPDPGNAQRQAFVAPHTELEKALAKIWQDVLKIERVGLTDNFFELGGDSILSLQVVARSRVLKAQGLSLKLRDLMQKPSIAELVASVQGTAGKTCAVLAMNAEVEAVAPLFCIHAGFGTVFDYEPLARRLSGRRQVLAIQSRMLLDPGFNDVSLQSMASDYVAQIREKQPQGPYHLLGWSLGGTLAALMAAQLEQAGQAVQFVGLVDSFVPSAKVNVGAVDDWRDDLREFLRVTLPEAADVNIEGEENAQNLRAVFSAAMATERGASTYVALGADELAHVFSVARRLKRLSRKLDRCVPLDVNPVCWWTLGREEEALELAGQLEQPGMGGEWLDCGHFQIPRDETFLLEAEEMLGEIVEPVAMS